MIKAGDLVEPSQLCKQRNWYKNVPLTTFPAKVLEVAGTLVVFRAADNGFIRNWGECNLSVIQQLENV